MNTKLYSKVWFLWRFIPHSHGADDMILIDKTSEVFGSYEIWQCPRCKFTEAI